jgi:predicted transcriptional regulator
MRMRHRKLDILLQVRVSGDYKRQLDEAAERLQVNSSALARLSLATGLAAIERTLPAEKQRSNSEECA